MSDAATAFAWLIETVPDAGGIPWWFASPGWTRDAWLATRYATKDEAEAAMRENHLTARAVEHGFMGDAPAAAIACDSCGYGNTDGMDCPSSKRECGHHCNHSWSHDECCWCGAAFGEIDAPAAAKAARCSSRKLARDVAWVEARGGNLRLALAILLWPPGWSHSRIEADRG